MRQMYNGLRHVELILLLVLLHHAFRRVSGEDSLRTSDSCVPVVCVYVYLTWKVNPQGDRSNLIPHVYIRAFRWAWMIIPICEDNRVIDIGRRRVVSQYQGFHASGDSRVAMGRPFMAASLSSAGQMFNEHETMKRKPDMNIVSTSSRL
ncbi:hypothetical protein BDQ12DRAFT_63898 [Crucibulum laeve]|uniref:Secreted protein n=1 Tax=Crucibulum laeve TaxID=68775 RepID=A0A5C3LIM5_9AGAR|nr:hypothetical protein BDQ12DRAFT_63898 [Crucibulum laeve]